MNGDNHMESAKPTEVADSINVKNSEREKFFLSDPQAMTIRAKVAEIVYLYDNFSFVSGFLDKDVQDQTKERVKRDLSKMFEDLEVLGISANMYVGQPTESFDTPMRIAQFVAGQIIKLRDTPIQNKSDLDRLLPKAKSYAGFTSRGKIRDLSKDATEQEGILAGARKLLGLPEISEDEKLLFKKSFRKEKVVN